MPINYCNTKINIDGQISAESGFFNQLFSNGFAVSVTGHKHTADDIIGLGELSIPSVTGIGYVVSSFNDNIYTISVSGLQPSGNYSVVGHTHNTSDIINFNNSVSGLIPVKNIIAGTNISVTNTSGIYTINSINQTFVNEANSLVTTVFNKTGSVIPKMTVVYINGGQGDTPTISLALANSEATSSKTYGITAEAIDNMSSGKVIVEGALTGLNTDQWNPTAPTGDINGTVLYLSPSTPGGITPIKPSAPDHLVSIGTVVRTHQNAGIIEVKIQNGFELQELHNVAISGVISGQFLQYNTSGLWAPSSSGNFTTLMVNGSGVSINGHTHNSNDIINFNSSVSGLFPNITGSDYINTSFANNTYTISTSGLQPSGNYSLVGHNHSSADINDFNTAVSGLLNSYAPLNNPNFSGIPTAPTAPSGTNTTQIANTQFVRTEISNFVDSSPEVLDTLNELAAALANDPNFATTITTSLANKVEKSGDTMTGSLYAPTGVFSDSLTLNGISVSINGHQHSSNDITNFNSSVSGILPSITGSNYITTSFANNIYTINANGLQPSGNYSTIGHTHSATDIISGQFDINRIPTGTSSNTVCIGNDQRLFDSRPPSGVAGGDLSGNYPNPTVASGAITYSKIQNVTSSDRLLGRQTAGAGNIEEIICTSFGRSIIDDIDAVAARTTLGAAAISHTHTASDIVSGTFDISRIPTGSTPDTVCIGDDSRLFNERTPLDNSVTTAKIFNNSITAIKLASDAIPLSIAEGRLSFISTPQQETDVINATTLYYHIYNGNKIALYNTSTLAWELHTFSQIVQPLGTLVANTNYDIFIYDDNGTKKLELFPWLNDTTRSVLVTRQNGIRVKSSERNKRFIGMMRTVTNTTSEDSINKRFLININNQILKTTRVSGITTDVTTTSGGFVDTSASLSATILEPGQSTVQIQHQLGVSVSTNVGTDIEIGVAYNGIDYPFGGSTVDTTNIENVIGTTSIALNNGARPIQSRWRRRAGTGTLRILGASRGGYQPACSLTITQWG